VSYCGRFAPSPSGKLHLGSLVAAFGSYLAARSRSGEWRLRIDDLDPPRVLPGAAESILATLKRFALNHDGEVVWQSQRSNAYHSALEQLLEQGMLYACHCSRKAVAERSGGTVYDGHCRDLQLPLSEECTWRLRVDAATPTVIEERNGVRLVQSLPNEVGDFVVRRADGIVAYHLATVVDDGWMGISEVVRGGDLLDSTPRQNYLRQLLGLPSVTTLHLPVVVDGGGAKWGKSQQSPAIDSTPDRVATLLAAWQLLGQCEYDPLLPKARMEEVIEWAVAHWQEERISAVPTVVNQASDHQTSLPSVRFK
jgi:glutamyl-Q tRNA(Asp) synthetase